MHWYHLLSYFSALLLCCPFTVSKPGQGYNSIHAGAPMDLLSFLVAFAAWEIIDVLLQVAMAHLARSAWFRRAVPDASARAKLATYGPAYAKSTLHALLVGARGWRHLWMLWDSSGVQKVQIVAAGQLYAGNARILHESEGVIRTNVVLGAYLASDLIHVILVYPALGHIDTVAHHVAFLACACVAGVTRSVPFMFGWLIVGECSTPLLNTRWLLINARRTHGLLFKLVQYSFAVSFIFLRLFVYGAGLSHHIYLLAIGTPVLVNRVAMGSIVALVVCGFVINLLWISKIFAALQRGGKKAVAVSAMEPPTVVPAVNEQHEKKQ